MPKPPAPRLKSGFRSQTPKKPKASAPPVRSPETYLYTPLAPTVSDPLHVAWCYPASYGVAMASLGWLLLFAQLDTHPLVNVTRLTAEDYPTARLTDVQVAGFSFSFELDILGVLSAFESMGLALLAEERAETDPLVFAGGPVPSTNPEPYAPFFDFFLIGEGEELLNETVAVLHRTQHLPRQQRLLALATEVVGVYVPALVGVSYTDPTHGEVAALTPLHQGMHYPIKKRWLSDLDPYVAASPILTEGSVFGHSYLLEVMRGCSHRCRFCLASYATLPARGASLEAIIAKLNEGLAHTPKVGLLGALIADHPQFAELCAYLDTLPDTQVSFGALRADTLTPAMCHTLQRSGGKSLTLAIESGSPALRQRINKHLSQQAILQAADTVAASGLKSLKLYGMVGLPTETDDDLQATIDLLRQIKKAHPALDLSLGCSTFVPKAWTPFQWMPRLPWQELKRRQEILRKGLVGVANFRPSSPKWDALQAMLSRGDRRLAPWLLDFMQAGGNTGAINRAYKTWEDKLPSLAWYGLRERPEAEVLPWDVLELTVPKAILYKEAFINQRG